MIFDLEWGADGEMVAATRRGVYWLGERGQVQREIRFSIEQPLLFTKLVGGDDGTPLAVGKLGDEVLLLTADGEIARRIPSLTGTVAFGDLAADGSQELVTAVQRRCESWWKLCTWLAFFDRQGEHLAHRATPFVLRDFAIVPRGRLAGGLVLAMFPDDRGRSRFEVWDRRLETITTWSTVPLGSFSLVERDGEVEVLTNEDDALVFRGLDGAVRRKLGLPHAGELHTPLWCDLGDGWGAAVVNGLRTPRFLLAVFDPRGESVYREVGAPHAEDLLADPEVHGRFYVPAGSEIYAYTVDRSR